MNMYTES